MKRSCASVLAAGLMAAGLLAHDAKLHQANATTGQITAVAANSFDLKTDKGTFKVTFSATTVFERNGTKVNKTQLAKGVQAGVIGTKLPTGELVAKEVLLEVDEAAGHEKSKTAAKAAEHKH